jgi:hypothetical protein
MRAPEAIVRLVAVFAVLAIATPAAAEPCRAGGPLFAIVPGTVKVTLRAGQTFKATLVCVDPDTLVVSEGARLRHVLIRDVARIVKPRDSIVNGALIGAGIGLLLGIVTYGSEASVGSSEDTYLLEAALTLGALGAGIDAMRGSSWTVYTAPADHRVAPRLAWRMRF